MVNGESADAWTDAFPAALYAKTYETPVVLGGTTTVLPETSSWLSPGNAAKTQVICGYSVGVNKACTHGPAASN